MTNAVFSSFRGGLNEKASFEPRLQEARGCPGRHLMEDSGQHPGAEATARLPGPGGRRLMRRQVCKARSPSASPVASH